MTLFKFSLSRISLIKDNTKTRICANVSSVFLSRKLEVSQGNYCTNTKTKTDKRILRRINKQITSLELQYLDIKNTYDKFNQSESNVLLSNHLKQYLKILKQHLFAFKKPENKQNLSNILALALNLISQCSQQFVGLISNTEKTAVLREKKIKKQFILLRNQYNKVRSMSISIKRRNRSSIKTDTKDK